MTNKLKQSSTTLGQRCQLNKITVILVGRMNSTTEINQIKDMVLDPQISVSVHFYLPCFKVTDKKQEF